MRIKWWLWILLGLGCVIIIGGILAIVLPIDNPQYAPGEACAMVDRAYGWPSNNLTEIYLGQGTWQVVSLSKYKLGSDWESAHPAIFRVYEMTNTVEMYNSIARWVIEHPQYVGRSYEVSELSEQDKELLEQLGK